MCQNIELALSSLLRPHASPSLVSLDLHTVRPSRTSRIKFIPATTWEENSFTDVFFFFKRQSYVDSRMKCYLSFGRCNVQKFVGKLVLGVVPVEFNYGKPSRRLHLGAVHRDLPGLTGHPLLGGHYATERGTNRNTKPHRHPEHNKKSFKMSNKTLVSRF